uniref:Uncharacterized protein n=1 Tax=Physcomitrium patens TaxID=3218 RepID=A0A2K1KBA1_PHYPA|nr:hypothetical protein PHYPA_010237 [Physcomitrium patens]
MDVVRFSVATPSECYNAAVVRVLALISEALSLICDGMGRPACTCAFADSDKII